MTARITFRVLALGYLALLLVFPVSMVFARTFQEGLGAVWQSVTDPAAVHALWMTLLIAAVAVSAN
ncbi:MAG TPA: hypothetical protein VKA82_10035, partial [Rubrobacter sp.]|nr:hypothetical protein [Rubrobacter sp.]